MKSHLKPEDAANIWIAALDLANATVAAARVTELEAKGVPPIDDDDAESRMQIQMSHDAHRLRLQRTITQHVTDATQETSP